jgi:hypothetical protein
MSKEQLVGTWKLVSAKARLSDGSVIDAFGEDPAGVIIYDAEGNVSVNLMRVDRRPFAAADKAKATPKEAQAALRGYEAYFGSYDVDEEKEVVIHHVEGSLLPNWTGTDQERFFKFSGQHLTLSTAEIPYNGTTLVGSLTWRRAA